ncbi:hypothetical protein CFAM422_006057 [Trichoderma lentiforme]|uniref:Uncharacterized protein n=1 Tax=Trichoderma lentiforme TaxID=1567552 RepID=A0A9P5CC36_9HYPO|nr:hypothetical protein CFAM422_006057 [Trichoderma lentiforme]
MPYRVLQQRVASQPSLIDAPGSTTSHPIHIIAPYAQGSSSDNHPTSSRLTLSFSYGHDGLRLWRKVALLAFRFTSPHFTSSQRLRSASISPVNTQN